MAQVTILLVIGYWMPSFLAIVRGHQSWWAIVAFNLFLGWTIVGWIFALVWSLTMPRWHSAVSVSNRFHGDVEAESARHTVGLPGA